MESHEAFARWATEKRGVKVNGIKAHEFEGRGLGITATKELEANTTLLSVPHAALLTTHSVPKTIKIALPKATVHNLLATQLCLEPSSPWSIILPSHASFASSMPLLYPAALHSFLPPAALSLVASQRQKLSRDWESTRSAFPSIEYADYERNWLIVNTRTFYFLASSHRGPPPARDDCLALQPYADYFNHSSVPTCLVSFTKTHYIVTSSTKILMGDELFISYGPHSNDFLLAEYGFVLDSNTNDNLALDSWLSPIFSTKQKARLVEEGFWGNWVLDARETCYRTQVAVRIRTRTTRQWDKLVRSGMDDGERDQQIVDMALLDVLKTARVDAAQASAKVAGVMEGNAIQKAMLCLRWQQIEKLLISAIERIDS